jgi:hypothetical protein
VLAGAEGAGFIGEIAGDFGGLAEGPDPAMGGEDGRTLGFEAGEGGGGVGVEIGGEHGGRVTEFVWVVKGFVWYSGWMAARG